VPITDSESGSRSNTLGVWSSGLGAWPRSPASPGAGGWNLAGITGAGGARKEWVGRLCLGESAVSRARLDWKHDVSCPTRAIAIIIRRNCHQDTEHMFSRQEESTTLPKGVILWSPWAVAPRPGIASPGSHRRRQITAAHRDAHSVGGCLWRHQPRTVSPVLIRLACGPIRLKRPAPCRSLVLGGGEPWARVMGQARR
jgi:hypothetical protein